MAATDSIRLLLVDTRALVRGALGCLLNSRPGFQVVGDAGTQAQALALAAQTAPDLILLSPQPYKDLGVDTVTRLQAAAGGRARVILLTASGDPEMHREALHSGAHGVVSLECTPDRLFKAITKVHEGELWLERRVMADMLGVHEPASNGQRPRIQSLTRREREVVGLVCEGLRNKQIARRLTVTDVTVRHHLTSVYSKLGVSDRLGLLIYANRNGLMPPLGRQDRHN